MSTHVEQIAIVVPADGKLALGIPYDCSSKTSITPDTAFEFDGDSEIEKVPIRSLKYNLNHSKETTDKEQTLEIGLEIILRLLGGLGDLPFGSVQYKTQYNSKLEKEHLQIYYYREDRVERLLPSTAVSDKIKAGLAGGVGSSTHIVSEVYYGVHMVANILITTNETNKLVNKSASGIGALVIGPISAGIEAALKAVLGDKPKPGVVDITVETTHLEEKFKEVTTVPQLFKLIREDLQSITDMKPLKMFCVPIGQFCQFLSETPDWPDPPKVHIISDIFLQPLTQMMATLKDFQDFENEDKQTEKSSHFRKKVMDGDHRLRIILEDEKNPITCCVLGAQENWNDWARDFFTDGKILVEGIPDGKTTEDDIQRLLSKYKDHPLNLNGCKNEIQSYIRKGKVQLSLINADDVDEYTKADFVSSLSKLEVVKRGLLRQDPSAVLLELKTNQDGNEDVPNGLFLAAYNLSAKIKVIVLMPNATTEFSLTITSTSFSAKYTTENGFEDIMMALEILSVAYGVSGGPLAKWYQALASESDISFPLFEKPFDQDVATFFEKCMQNYKNVQTFPTFLSLKSHILDSTLESNIMICLPVSSYVPLIEGTAAFIKLHELLAKPEYRASTSNYEFLVGEFDLGFDDAPLVLVFQAGKLEAACLAALDVFKLLYLVEKGLKSKETPSFSLLSNNISTFFPLRIEYHNELKKVFQFSLYQKSALVHHPKVLELTDPTLKLNVDTALEISAAYLAIENREERMITTLTLKLLELEPDYISRLEDLGWSPARRGFTSSNIFGADQRKPIRGFFMDMLFESSELLTKLGALIHTMDFSIQTFNAKPEEDTAAFTELQDMITKGFVKEFSGIDSGTVSKIEQVLLAPLNVETVTAALEIAHEELMLHANFATIEASKISHLQSILSILPVIKEEVDETAPPDSREYFSRITRWKEESEEAFYKIVSTFILKVDWKEKRQEIEGWLSSRLILKIVNELGSMRYPAWHQTISESFRQLKGIQDFEGLMEIVGTKIEGVVEELMKQQHFIWSNPPYWRMIMDAIDSPGTGNFDKYAEMVMDAVGGDAKFPKIPQHIPTPLARVLRQYIYDQEQDQPVVRMPKKYLNAKKDGIRII